MFDDLIWWQLLTADKPGLLKLALYYLPNETYINAMPSKSPLTTALQCFAVSFQMFFSSLPAAFNYAHTLFKHTISISNRFR